MRTLERIAWATGVLTLGVWALMTVAGGLGAARQLDRFAALRAAGRLPGEPPDQTLWSPERIRAWEDSKRRSATDLLAVLTIERIGLVVPVLPGTGEWALNRGVGLIEETAPPGSPGNVGIAGHRDGFFRGLQKIGAGDTMTLETPRGIDTYRVERVWIVTPDDVSVLDPTAVPSITLVTCYPFYFVGPAPQRFIVRATRVASTPRT